MISFIVPAHNEEVCLARTLPAIHESARATSLPYEIIVVDDASTDATAEIARQHNARVVSVNHRQIAATRNSGARAAGGDRFFFVDADTTINARAVSAALRCMDRGVVGGGAPFWVEGAVPLYISLIAMVGGIFMKLVGFPGGAFIFCTREAFAGTGGFNERLYCGEEGLMALALRREGRFMIIWQRVLTSGRRFRRMSGLQVIAFCLRIICSPFKTVTRRAGVQKVWYDSDRSADDEMPDSLAVKISNGILLFLLVVVITEPLWNRIPWALTPLATPLGKVRILIVAVLCHLGLIFWPVALVFLTNFFRQKRPTGWAQSLALTAFCVWQGWGAVRGVAWIWARLLLAVGV
jgi:glycosyltransferase involved in cell wall biosynthesis